jgi:hypothetical protein
MNLEIGSARHLSIYERVQPPANQSEACALPPFLCDQWLVDDEISSLGQIELAASAENDRDTAAGAGAKLIVDLDSHSRAHAAVAPVPYAIGDAVYGGDCPHLDDFACAHSSWLVGGKRDKNSGAGAKQNRASTHLQAPLRRRA